MKNTDALRDSLQYACLRLILGRPRSLPDWEAHNQGAPEGQSAGNSQRLEVSVGEAALCE